MGVQVECPSFESTRVFTCIDPDLPDDKCQIGCSPCPDQVPDLVGSWLSNQGKRWVRPHPTLPARDAYGRFGALKSGTPRLVPSSIVYESAPCFFQDGRECFAADVCDCHPPESFTVLQQTNRCEFGEVVNEVLRGQFPDCWFKKGSGWSGSTIQCRAVGDHGPLALGLTEGPMHQAMFARYGACLSNVFIPCMARIEPGGLCDGAAGTGNTTEYYFDHICRQSFFNALGIRFINIPKLRASEYFTLADPAVVDVKNKALARVFQLFPRFPDGSQGVRFSELDNAHFANGFGSGNAKLNLWAREWDGPGLIRAGVAVEPEQFPTILNMPDCYLAQSGCRVSAQVKIKRVSITMHMVANQQCIQSTPGGVGILELVPSIRVQIHVDLSVYATLEDPACVLKRPWLKEDGDVPLEIVNHPVGDGFPSVREVGTIPVDGQDRDTLIYVHPDLNTPFTVPDRVDWYGWLGAFSDPPATNVWPADSRCGGSGNTLSIFCRKVIDQMSFLEVPTWPTLLATAAEDPNQLYGGDFLVRMRPETFC